MPRPRRAVLAAAALLPLSSAACAAGPGAIAAPRALEVPAGSLLRPLGALLIDTDAIGFGGLSGLHLGPDLRLAAVSDRGRWLTAQLVLRDGRPVALEQLRTGPLRDGSGAPLTRGFRGDAESLARLPDGTWIIGFERWHRIRAHRPGLDAPGRFVDMPAELSRAPGNGGLEALAVLPDGRWLLIAESLAPPDGPGLRRAWIGQPGAWTALAYRPEAGMEPVDATALEDGSVLVLERSFSFLGGFGGRLARVPAAALAAPRADTVLEPAQRLLRIEPPLPVDNYEGVAAARVDGRTLVALVSDDNENAMQRTWLLLFALDAR